MVSSVPTFAVVTDHPLPTKGSAPQVCYLKFSAQGDFLHPQAACTGTLIRSNRLLTAAHCLDNFTKGFIADVICNNGKQDFSVIGYEAHPEFFQSVMNGMTLQDRHDVALIDIKVKKNPISPMPVASTYEELTALLAHSEKCVLYGYGRPDDGNGNNWGNLILSTIDYLTPAAWKALSTWDSDPQTFFIGPKVRAAPGDSGGPILCTKDDGSLVQIATTMVQGQLTDKDNPNAGFRYSEHEAIPYNYNWINQAADLPALSHKL